MRLGGVSPSKNSPAAASSASPGVGAATMRTSSTYTQPGRVPRSADEVVRASNRSRTAVAPDGAVNAQTGLSPSALAANSAGVFSVTLRPPTVHSGETATARPGLVRTSAEIATVCPPATVTAVGAAAGPCVPGGTSMARYCGDWRACPPHESVSEPILTVAGAIFAHSRSKYANDGFRQRFSRATICSFQRVAYGELGRRC